MSVMLASLVGFLPHTLKVERRPEIPNGTWSPGGHASLPRAARKVTRPEFSTLGAVVACLRLARAYLGSTSGQFAGAADELAETAIRPCIEIVARVDREFTGFAVNGSPA